MTEHINSWQSALEMWADMYNKLDQERFKLLLENEKLKAKNDSLEEENYKKVWCDMLLNKIEEIAEEKYPNIEYWIDTGSRLNCALEMLETFKKDLKKFL